MRAPWRAKARKINSHKLRATSPSRRMAPPLSKSVKPGPEDEHLNDDERERFYWETRYPSPVAQRLIFREAVYVVVVVFIALLGLCITWHGGLVALVSGTCTGCDGETFRKYLYLFISGLLGGALFGLKYLYKVVARGWWNQDRAIWRYTSPWLSAGLALAIGALAEAGIFGFATNSANSSAAFVSLGFIVGYFADKASGKMQEVAETLFGHPAPTNLKKGEVTVKDGRAGT